VSFPRLHQVVIAVALALGAAACGAAAGPQVKVLGVSEQGAATTAQPHSVVVFLQVRNPSNRPIKLSRLQYTFSADGASKVGNLTLSRSLAGDAAVIVEVPIELHAPADGEFHLDGKLYAFEDQIVRSWKVNAVGTFAEAEAPMLRAATAPEPTSVTAPEPTSVTAPDPASVQAPD
jgi:hypothetical protein